MQTWEQMSRKDQLIAMHYDFYKSVHGIRPRWMNYDEMSEQDIERELDQLEADSIIQQAREAEREKAAIKNFEMHVAVLRAAGAKDRDQAIAWIRQANNAEHEESDYLCYLLGLPYGYLDKKVV